ncbi:MAG: MFS transporter [Planctomycetota bacterium]
MSGPEPRHDPPRAAGALAPAARWYLYGCACMGATQAIAWTFFARWLNVLGHTKTEIGTFQSVDSWGKVVVAIPAAFVLARRPARGVFVAAAVVAGASYAVLPHLPSLGWMYAVNFVAGIAMTVHYVAIAPFLFRHTTAENRARVFSQAEAVRTGAAVLGAGLGGQVVAGLTERLGGEAAATGVVVSAGGAFALMAALFYSFIDDARPPAEERGAGRAALREHGPLIARFATPQFLVACGAGFCIPFLPTYFQERFAVDPDGWGLLFASGQVLMTAGFLLTPIALRRLGFVRSMVAIEVSSLPFFLCLAFTGSLWLAVLAFLMRGALMNATHPIHKNLMMQASPPAARELQTGVNATLWGVGWVIGPLAAGRVLDATGNDYAVLMCTTVAIYAVAATLTFLLLRGVEARLGLDSGPRGGESAR